MVLPPAGPPPPTGVPEGWKAHWNAEYKAWFYENIYTEESVWQMPTEPAYPPQSTARLPPGPPPGYQAVQQPTPVEKDDSLASLPSTIAAVSLSDGSQYGSQQQPPTYGAAAPQQLSQAAYPSPPPNASSPQPAPGSLYGATPQAARAPSPQPAPGSLYGATPQAARAPSPQPAALNPPSDVSRDYPQAPQYAPQAAYPAYPPQQAPSGYPPQQPQYAPQANYSPQPQYAQPPQAAPAQKKGFMGMLQGKVGNKVPGGANTLLGVGGGLLAGAVLEHEWDKHEERERRHHHHGFGGGMGGGLGGLGGLMRGFGGDSGGVVVENVTVDENVYVDNDNSFINF